MASLRVRLVRGPPILAHCAPLLRIIFYVSTMKNSTKIFMNDTLKIGFGPAVGAIGTPRSVPSHSTKGVTAFIDKQIVRNDQLQYAYQSYTISNNPVYKIKKFSTPVRKNESRFSKAKSGPLLVDEMPVPTIPQSKLSYIRTPLSYSHYAKEFAANPPKVDPPIKYIGIQRDPVLVFRDVYGVDLQESFLNPLYFWRVFKRMYHRHYGQIPEITYKRILRLGREYKEHLTFYERLAMSFWLVHHPDAHLDSVLFGSPETLAMKWVSMDDTITATPQMFKAVLGLNTEAANDAFDEITKAANNLNTFIDEVRPTLNKVDTAITSAQSAYTTNEAVTKGAYNEIVQTTQLMNSRFGILITQLVSTCNHFESIASTATALLMQYVGTITSGISTLISIGIDMFAAFVIALFCPQWVAIAAICFLLMKRVFSASNIFENIWDFGLAVAGRFASSSSEPVTNIQTATPQMAGIEQLLFGTLTASTYAGLFKWVFNEMPRKTNVDNFVFSLDLFSKIDRAKSAFQNSIEMFHTIITKCTDYILGSRSPFDLFRDELAEYRDEVIEWAAAVQEMDDEDTKRYMELDEATRERVFKLQEQANSYIARFGKDPSPKHLTTLIHKYVDRCRKMYNYATNFKILKAYKYDPFSICLVGAEGVGKSAICNELAIIMAAEDHVPLLNGHILYGRNAGDKFWVNFNSSVHAVMVDDFLQLSSGEMPDRQLAEVTNIKSNNPYYPPLADVDEKGRPFESKILLLSTNNAYPRPNNYNEIGALWRRRNVMYRCVINPDYIIKIDGKDECDWSRVTDETKMATDNKSPLDFPYMRFGKMNPKIATPPEQIPCNMDFLEMKHDMLKHWKEYDRGQRNLLRAYEYSIKSRRDEQLARPDDPTPTLIPVTAHPQATRFNDSQPNAFIHNPFFPYYASAQNDSPNMNLFDYWNEAIAYLRDQNLITLEYHINTKYFEAQQHVYHIIVYNRNDLPMYKNLSRECHKAINTVLNLSVYEIPHHFLKPYMRHDPYAHDYHFLQIFTSLSTTGLPERIRNRPFSVLPATSTTDEMTDFEMTTQRLAELRLNFTQTATPQIWTCSCKEEEYYPLDGSGPIMHKLCDQECDDFTHMRDKWEPDFIAAVRHLFFKNKYHDQPRLYFKVTSTTLVSMVTIVPTDPKYMFTEDLDLKAAVLLNDIHPKIVQDCYDYLRKSDEDAQYERGIHGENRAPVASLLARLTGEDEPNIIKRCIDSILSSYTNIRDKIAKKLAEMPVWKTVLMVVAGGVVISCLSAAVWGIYNYFYANTKPTDSMSPEAAKPMKNFYEDKFVTESGTYVGAPKKAHVAPRVNRVPRNAFFRTAEPHGSENQNVLDTATYLKQNLVRINRYSTQKGALNGVMLCDRYMLIPFHFFEGVKINDKMGFQHRTQEFIFRYDPSKVQRIGKEDMVIYNLTGTAVPQFRDIRKHFVTNKDVEKHSENFRGLLIEPQYNQKYYSIDFIQHPVDIKSITYAATYAVGNEIVSTTVGYEHNADTPAGSCGSILLSSDKYASRHLLGIHVAGYDNHRGGAVPLLTQEIISQFICNAQPQIFEYEKQAIFNPVGKPRIDTSGNFDVIGCLHSSLIPFDPTSTALRPSTIQGAIFPVEDEPAVLSAWDERNKSGISPLTRGLNKFSKPSIPFNVKHRKIIHEHNSSYDIKNIRPLVDDLTCKSIEEALNGRTAEYYDKINMNSSTGYPWNLYKPNDMKGKTYLIDVDPNTLHLTISDPTLKRAVTDRILRWSTGSQAASYWKGQLKDELRPLPKIENGETRLFMMPDISYTLATRLTQFDWTAAVYDAHHNSRFYSAVGINVDSYSWTARYEAHRRISVNVIAGDYSDFDGTIIAECVYDLYEEMSDWYDHYTNNANTTLTLFDDNGNFKDYTFTPYQMRLIRRMAGQEIYYTPMVIANVLLFKSGGQCSGCNITALLNNKVGYKYILHALLNFCDDNNDFSFFKNLDKCMQITTYGDDVLLSVCDELLELGFDFYYIQKFLAQHRIQFTDATKSLTPPRCIPLLESTFLKRGFRPDDDYPNIIHPTIDFKTIKRLTNWCHDKHLAVEEATLENAHSALAFAYHHGEKEYNKLFKQIRKALYPHNMFIEYQYTMLHHEFLKHCSMFLPEGYQHDIGFTMLDKPEGYEYPYLLIPGRIYEVNRGPYSHFGIAVDASNIIHLTPARSSNRAVVKITDRFRFQDGADGTFNPMRLVEIPEGAVPQCDRDGIRNLDGTTVDYHIRDNNCEHWCYKMVYGYPFSSQSERIRNTSPAAYNIGPLVAKLFKFF